MIEKQSDGGVADIYRQLAVRLDEIPNGFPATETGVELRILSRLFRPDEAAIVLELKLSPEPVEKIAERLGQEPDALSAKLSDMAERGLIRLKTRKEGPLYGLMPFVVGIYELQLERMDEELAQLFEDYYHEAFHELLDVQPAIQRVIPVEQSVPVDIGVVPYETASQLLGQAQSWGVMDCICRKQKRLIGQGCEHPIDVCLIFSRRPGTFDDSESIRALTKEEALGVLRRAEDAGLVHTVENTQEGVFYMCNCCTCSCAILQGVARYGMLGAVAPSSLRSRVDENICTGCELCIDRCPFGALSVADGICRVDATRCFGCGLCVPACPDEALTMVRRPEGEVATPPRAMSHWMIARAGSRGIDREKLEHIIGRVQEKGAG
jgi:Pyruvate/2-oxoacid:ferredoxin oxidoreductase delta subunit